MDLSSIQKLAGLLRGAKRAVFFGGAGVSTESGIPDFRSTDGLYHQQWRYPPETILSHDFFRLKTDEFYDFYRQKMLCPQARPNPAHEALAELERRGVLSAVITQNIDGLHQAAGSKTVYELHGSIHRNYCMRCSKFFSAEFIKNNTDPIPRCPECGGIIKPDVVLYEEGLDNTTIDKSVSAISNADCLIIGGTSLAVYPAASLIHYFRGKHLVLINKSTTQYDSKADCAINEKIGEVLGQNIVR